MQGQRSLPDLIEDIHLSHREMYRDTERFSVSSIISQPPHLVFFPLVQAAADTVATPLQEDKAEYDFVLDAPNFR